MDRRSFLKSALAFAIAPTIVIPETQVTFEDYFINGWQADNETLGMIKSGGYIVGDPYYVQDGIKIG